MSNFIAVRHNIEVAHRLFDLPGKCEQIHGHSMWVTLYLKGTLDPYGILEAIDFSSLKKSFRSYLDETYDHRLLLNASDPFAGPVWRLNGDGELGEQMFLPGLQAMANDPTTENLAMWIGEDMADRYEQVSAVEVWETSVNMARWEA